MYHGTKCTNVPENAFVCLTLFICYKNHSTKNTEKTMMSLRLEEYVLYNFCISDMNYLSGDRCNTYVKHLYIRLERFHESLYLAYVGPQDLMKLMYVWHQ